MRVCYDDSLTVQTVQVPFEVVLVETAGSWRHVSAKSEIWIAVAYCNCEKCKMRKMRTRSRCARQELGKM